MKRNLHVVALVLFLLSLAYNLLVWGAAPRLPDVGDAFAASARREAPLAATYMMLGGPLDAAVPAFQGFGERRLTSALGAGFERIRADSTVAMDLIFTSTWNVHHRWLKTVYWLTPLLLVITLLLFWRRPRKVHTLGGHRR
ncbi:MAG TPA: hypothetical protein VF422_00115 [Dokdonella sp.]